MNTFCVLWSEAWEHYAPQYPQRNLIATLGGMEPARQQAGSSMKVRSANIAQQRGKIVKLLETAMDVADACCTKLGHGNSRRSDEVADNAA